MGAQTYEYAIETNFQYVYIYLKLARGIYLPLIKRFIGTSQAQAS